MEAFNIINLVFLTTEWLETAMAVSTASVFFISS